MEFTERNTIPELDAQSKEAITREWADVMIFIQRLNARRADFALTRPAGRYGHGCRAQSTSHAIQIHLLSHEAIPGASGARSGPDTDLTQLVWMGRLAVDAVAPEIPWSALGVISTQAIIRHESTADKGWCRSEIPFGITGFVNFLLRRPLYTGRSAKDLDV
jgi:hypothetical protein